VPVTRFDPVARGHLREQRCTRIRRQNMECGRRNPGFDSPIHRTREDVAVVSVQSEDEAAIDHDAEAVESADYFTVIPAEVLPLAGALEATTRERFEPHKQTSQTGGGRLFDQIIAQNRVDSRRSLKDAAHPLHAAEQLARESWIPKEMIVQKVEVPPRQARNFSQRVV